MVLSLVTPFARVRPYHSRVYDYRDEKSEMFCDQRLKFKRVKKDEQPFPKMVCLRPF